MDSSSILCEDGLPKGKLVSVGQKGLSTPNLTFFFLSKSAPLRVLGGSGGNLVKFIRIVLQLKSFYAPSPLHHLYICLQSGEVGS